MRSPRCSAAVQRHIPEQEIDMEEFTLARVVHVIAVLFWIGGVAFVTTVAMPAIRRQYGPSDRLAAFHEFEGPFARQARFWVLLAGASGLWMSYRGDLWARFTDLHFWWMHAMVGVWVIFAIMLFVLEPLALHRRMKASANPARDFARMERVHRLLLGLSLIAVAGAVAGSHGLL